ncbi:hypothetical protein ES703_123984 [subsurface metagenome]
MTKRKYPSELSTRTIRVNVGDWHLLLDLSSRLGITVAKAFHEVLTGQEHKAPPVKPEQILFPLEILSRSTPVTSTRARSIPITSTRARSTPVTISFSREVENVNRDRQNANGHRQND